ncbi:hypothetical protein ISS04_03385 [Candidatus Woesearchaeota archaeon]|nr:hypothetical protein [Candidatus Woesearchaeota archaeon]
MIKKTIKIIFILGVFMLGWLANSTYPIVLANSVTPFQTFMIYEEPSGPSAKERHSPYDHIKESQIKVFNDKVIIDIENPEWATFTDTNSMDPVIDAGANAIEIIPKTEDQIHLGDIISYNSVYADGSIIHRVTNIGQDKQGWYCKVKGDNNNLKDPGKIRFDQIQRVVVAIIY